MKLHFPDYYGTVLHFLFCIYAPLLATHLYTQGPPLFECEFKGTDNEKQVRLGRWQLLYVLYRPRTMSDGCCFFF